MTATGRVRLGVVVVLVALAAACGDTDDGTAASTTASTAAASSGTTASLPADDLPPAGALDLEADYGAALADLGMRLTDRGGLIDVSEGGYVPSPTGRHLALYVAPIGDRTVSEYIEGIRAVAVVFADVFERWPGLESYDVCQEPVETDGTQTEEPLPTTQIVLTREQDAAVDWDAITVVDMVRAARDDPPGMTVRVGPAISKDPEFQAITAEALGTP